VNLKVFFSRLNGAQQGDSHVLHWGVLCIVLILLHSFLLVPYIDWLNEREDALDSGMKKMAKMVALKSVEAEWFNALEILQHEHEKVASRLIFFAASKAAAQGMFQMLVKLTADKAGLKLLRIDFLESGDDPGSVGAEKLMLSISLRGGLKRHLDFLDALVKQEKLIVVRHWHFSVQKVGDSSGNMILNAYYQKLPKQQVELSHAL